METKEQIPSYEMFSKAGDRACHSLVKRVTKKINGKLKVSKEELDEIITEGLKKIAEKHGEVFDTEPPYHISHELNKVLQKNGYGFELSRYDW